MFGDLSLIELLVNCEKVTMKIAVRGRADLINQQLFFHAGKSRDYISFTYCGSILALGTWIISIMDQIHLQVWMFKLCYGTLRLRECCADKINAISMRLAFLWLSIHEPPINIAADPHTSIDTLAFVAGSV